MPSPFEIPIPTSCVAPVSSTNEASRSFSLHNRDLLPATSCLKDKTWALVSTASFSSADVYITRTRMC